MRHRPAGAILFLVLFLIFAFSLYFRPLLSGFSVIWEGLRALAAMSGTELQRALYLNENASGE